MKNLVKRCVKIVILSSLCLTFVACNKKEKATILLDWSININHVGLFVAKEKGFFDEVGLDVDLIIPPAASVIDLILQKKGILGISSTEELVFARENGLQIKAVGTIFNGNYSSFASLKEDNIVSPKDFVGKNYASWGSSIEKPILKTLMKKDGIENPNPTILNLQDSADINALKLGLADYIWTYKHHDGVAAKLMGFDLNYIALKDFDERLNYYTPIFITSDDYLTTEKAKLKKLSSAIAKGYLYAMANHDETVKIMMKNAPSVNKDLWANSLKECSTMFLSDNTGKFGIMKDNAFAGYVDYLKENNLLTKDIDSKDLYTNDLFN